MCLRSRAHRYDLRQEVEGFVNGRLSIKVVVLRAEFVMQDRLQAFCEGAGLILQPGGLLMHDMGVLLQLLVLPASTSGTGTTPNLCSEDLLDIHHFYTLLRVMPSQLLDSWCK